jgi:hypothetical protein
MTNPPSTSRSLASLLVAALAAVWIASTAYAHTPEKVLRVFLFMGQSNMVGADSRVEDVRLYAPFAGLDRPQEGVKFSYCIGREDKAQSEGWTALQPVHGMVGPELSFARRVAQQVAAPIAVIKVAAGGTTLCGDWNPDEPRGFKLYPLALARVRAALAELERSRTRYRVEGFMWHQGENDMFDAACRAAYAKNLANFAACWRRDLGLPELRFYIGELCTKTVWGMDHRVEMHALGEGQQTYVAGDPLARFVRTSQVGVEIGGDGGLHYHYGTLGQLEHGVNYADAYLEVLGRRPQAERRLSEWPYAKGAKVKLYVLAGHRNMEGERAFVQDLAALEGRAALARDDARIAYKYSVGGGSKVSNGWEPLGPAGQYDTFGPELSFAATLARTSKDAVAIAKFTHSGSQVVDWTPEGSQAASRNLYPAFLEFVRASVRELEERGQVVQLAGIVYHLGENDMSFGPYRRQAVAQLAALVAQSRKDLGRPELRWIVSQQPPTMGNGLDSIDVTAGLERLAAADPQFVHLKVFDLPGCESPLVITTPGIVALGERLAEACLQRR